MTLEEAKVRARQLNSQLEFKRQEEQLLKIEEKNQIFRTRFDSMLPIEFVGEFEKRFMRKRDSEVDRGKRRTSSAMHVWNIEETCNPKILWVYQTKIVSLPHEDRRKPIPILFDEQEFALRVIKSQKIQRPLVKTVHQYFGDGIDLYGGRKGFVDLMLSKGHKLENISV